MLTPQEVSARSFTKAVMGGYNMTMVDEFLDELTDDYTSLYKENASLKAKLKVLVEKVEEYRSTEDAMRAALLAAQRMADTIVQEAQAKAEEIRKQADSSAREQIERSQRELAESQEKLRQGQLALQSFIDEGKKLCGQAAGFLDKLPEYAPETAPPPAQVEQIEQSVLSAAMAAEPASAAPAQAAPAQAAPAETPEPALQTAAPTTKISTAAVSAAAEAAPAPVPEPSAAEPKPDLDATRRVNLNDLKFGPKYRGESR